MRGFFVAMAVMMCTLIIAGFGYARYLAYKVGDYPHNESVNEATAKPIGNEPINILLLGSDARDKKEMARTDTIIFVRLIPKTGKVVMMSIPRDLRIEIPGKGVNKINAAHAFGGPELAIRTVSAFTGLDIHHYVEVQFWGFEKIVDALGGVTINVEKPLEDKKSKFGIPAGVHKMDGELALNYCRFRKDQQGDFGRMERQQIFFKALLDESMRFRSMFKIPSIMNIVAENTQTDMSSSQMLSTAFFLAKLDSNDLETVTIPGSSKMINGISYVVGDDKAIQEILTKIKNNETLQPPVNDMGALAQNDGGEDVKLSKKDITVSVLNGCGEQGIARVLSDLLETREFTILEEPKNADHTQGITTIYYKPGMKKRAEMIADYFSEPVIEPSDGSISSAAQVVVVVGEDHRRVLSI